MIARRILLIVALLVPAALLAAASNGTFEPAYAGAPAAPGEPGGPPTGRASPPVLVPPALPQPPPALVPPPLPQETAQFFYDDGGKPAGPFKLSELRAKVTAGSITGSTLVWKAGTPDWMAAKDQPDVASLLAAPPAPGPSTATVPPADLASFFVGTWQSEDDAGPPGSVGPARLTMTLAKGGTLSGTYAFTMAGSPRTSLPVTGFWSAASAGAKRAELTLGLFIQNGAQTQTLSTSAVVDMVDNDTLRDTSDGSLTTRVKP